jgi:predicted amidohydrolase YtcJ
MQEVIKRCLATREGMRPGPEPRWLVLGGWIPEQAMTREEALRAATMRGAYVMFAEDILGSIEVGKLADFVVIPVDYMLTLSSSDSGF